MYEILVTIDEYESHYRVYYRSGDKCEFELGVIDDCGESINDYLDTIQIFNRNKRFGKIARRWFNRNIIPQMNLFGYTNLSKRYYYKEEEEK